MRKQLWGAGMVLACFAATAFAQAQQTNTLNCKLFQVQPDQHQITVIQGNFQQSGAGGNDQPNEPDNAKAKRYTVQVTDQTNIRWQGGDQITLKQLQQMSQRRITIPMMVSYDKSDQLDESRPVKATSIILKGSPPKQ